MPLFVAVLMDTSPSTAGKLKFQQESAMNFIKTVVKARKDRVLFGTFDDEITLLQDFTVARSARQGCLQRQEDG